MFKGICVTVQRTTEKNHDNRNISFVVTKDYNTFVILHLSIYINKNVCLLICLSVFYAFGTCKR